MQSVMFVCLGNICRSPLAQTLFEENIQKEGLLMEVDSSGLGPWHQGELADPRMRAVAMERGVNITHRAKQLTKGDLEHFETIFVMAEDVYLGLVAQFDPLFRFKEKIHFFKAYDPLEKGLKDVLDPYHGEKKDFEQVFDVVSRTCENLVTLLKKGKKW